MRSIAVILVLVETLFVVSNAGSLQKKQSQQNSLKSAQGKMVLERLFPLTKENNAQNLPTRAKNLRYTSGEAQETSGFEILGISFNASCFSQGCWDIDIQYNFAPRAVTVLYLPRTNGDDTQQNGGGYSTSVIETFEPKRFPCGVMGAGGTNACCVQEVTEKYRTPLAFETLMSATNFSSCPGPLTSSIVGEAIQHSFVQGKFAGMHYSEIVLTSGGEYHGTVRLKLDEKEVRTLAGKIQGHTAVEYSVAMFIGLVSFVPTRGENGEWSTFLQSYHTQTPITLMKKSFAQIVLNGGFSSSLLNYVGTVLHNIHVSDGTHANQNAQFIQMSFTMPERFSPAGNELIPFSSVRVGKGNSSSNVQNWVYTCGISTSDVPTIYGATGVSAAYEALSQETCAPPVDMCSQPATVANGFISYQFPLGFNFFDQESDIDVSIFLEFVVSVEDTEHQLSSSTAMIEIPLEQAGHVKWCHTESASTDLLNIANVDIVIGTATSQGQLESQLTVLQNVLYADATAHTSAQSLQSGLVSVVLKGADSFFELPRAKNFYLELEDVVSLHILETTSTKYDAVTALLGAGGAFETVISGEGSSARASIDPTIALTNICPDDASDMSCVTRRDVYRRASSKLNPTIGSSETYGVSALEINPDDTNDAKAFMQDMLGTSSAWASGLGSQFSDLLTRKYSLNSRSKRAWWINPGSDWTSEAEPSKYTLPSKMIVAMLVSLNEQGYTRRRALVVSGAEGSIVHPIPPRRHASKFSVPHKTIAGGLRSVSESSQATTTSKISYKVNAAEQIMTALGVDAAKSTTFQVEYEMPKDLLCMSETQAKKRLAQTLLACMKKAADVESVIVTSINVPAESKSECRRRLHTMLRSLKAAGSAAVKIEMLVVFKTSANMKINEAAFLAIPGMLAITPTQLEKVQIDNTFVPPAQESPTDDPNDVPLSETGAAVVNGKAPPVMSIALGCTGAVALLATASAIVMRRQAKKERSWTKPKFHMDHTLPVSKDSLQDSDCAHAQVIPGMRLRRTVSHEEMMLEQEMGVTSLQRTTNCEAIRSIAFNDDVSTAESGASSMFSTRLAEKSNIDKDAKCDAIADRFAYIKGVLSTTGSAGKGYSTASSMDCTSPDKIEMDFDVVDWKAWRSRSIDTRASSRKSSIDSVTDGSRSTSPLLRGGDSSPTGSFRTSQAYRSDLAARELRRASKGSLQSAFDLQEEIEGSEVQTGFSIKDLKNTLRSLGATEQDILRCMERSDLEHLIVVQASKKEAPAVTAEDVESRLFRTHSGGKMRSAYSNSEAL